MSPGNAVRARCIWLREQLTHDRILQIHSQTLWGTFAVQKIRHDCAESLNYGLGSFVLASAMVCGHLFVHGIWRKVMVGAGVAGTLVGTAFMVNVWKLWEDFRDRPRGIQSSAWMAENRPVTLNLSHFLRDADDKHVDCGNGIEDRVTHQSSQLPDIYFPLFPLVSAIRVLEIEPGTFDADIECEMSPWYDGDQGYTALSYVWGDDPPTKSMWVDRELVMIRKNLDNAIRYIRDENEPVRLWVDAICINQQDLSERTSQVEMMSEIYQQAQGLFVFLGEGGEDLSTLFAFIQDINDDIPIDEVIEKADILRVLDQFWQLLQMPWWSRIWIIQEFAYADASPTFVYGHRKFSASWLWYGFGVLRDVLLRDLYCFVQISDGNPQMDDSALPLWRGAGSVSQGLHILRSRQQLFHWRQQPVPATHKVSELLKDTQFYLATEPRDRLFALHSLMMDPLRACFLPDYHQSIRAVNIRMAAYLLCIEGWAEMYNYFPTTADATLPSWVPNFSTNRERDKWFRIWDNSNSPGQHSWKLDCWAEGAILGIRGVHCGTVTEIPGLNWKGKNMTVSLQDSSAASCSQSGDGCHDVNNFQTFPQILAETDSPIRLKMTSPGCSTWLISSKLVHEARRLPRIKAYFHEVLTKLRRRRLTKNSYGQLDFGRLDFRGHLTAPMIEERLRMTPKWEDSGIDEAWIDVKMQLGKSSDRWPDEHFQGLVFTTDTGFTGLCPLQTQIGDKLVVLKGMPTTFLARADESDGQYMLIGPVRVTKDTLIGILTEATHKSNLETFYFK